MSPYDGLPETAFWRTAVQNANPAEMDGIYVKKFSLQPDWGIATAGSCFAQHIARHLTAAGYKVLDFEPAPPGLRGSSAQQFGYQTYSARYGNIYTTRQFLQLIEEARGRLKPTDFVWTRDDRFFDAFRPGVEPEGLSSEQEVVAHRSHHLERVRRLFASMNVLIFTMGLTEAWEDQRTGLVYPTAPGTICGEFDPGRFVFKNFSFSEIYGDFLRIRRILQARNPTLRFLLTVSPVPLTATASGDHVLVATMRSKAILRAVAGQLVAEFDDVDYFPSFEIINNPAARSGFFLNNLRSVDLKGVEAVMRCFFAQHHPNSGAGTASPAEAPSHPVDAGPEGEAGDVVCEEMLLDAFAEKVA